ncbi:MAG: Nramp family divalent metal transporter [Candidatus Neomarinimicrobiota bacterium]|nr:Nramp family divalent metal transporter [Candidatus Neomarinimicrobiota bacterium]
MIADRKRADIPERTQSFWKLAGPGVILVGLSIGAGEIIIWPRIVAEYGPSMIWAAALGISLQLVVNLEIGRWTIATGETIFTGFSRIWKGFGSVFILLTLVGWLAPGWARASGLALKALLVGPTGYGSDVFWTIITFLMVAGILFGPKIVYQSMEKTILMLVVLVTVGLITLAFAIGSAEVWLKLGGGLINIGYLDPGISVKSFFIAIVFAGAGGTANLFYSFYLRDKNIGMGAKIPRMNSPFRGKVEAVPATGFLFDETPKNLERFRSWWNYVRLDQTFFFWFLNTFTILLFVFGALAILHPRGIVPTAGTLIWDEAEILAQVWGEAGRTIFLVVGFATLFGTQIAIIDGCSRTIADIVYTASKSARKRGLSWLYLMTAGGWMVAGCVITFVMEQYGITDLGFILNAAYMGGFAMAVYVPLTLYMNHRYLPKAVRPKLFATSLMSIASLIYVGFAVASVIWEVTSRF